MALSVSQNSPPEARSRSGRLRGVWRDSSAAFLGIPFAAPPVDDRRFLAPDPVTPWDGVRDATRYGATAQRRPFGDNPTIPEPSIPGDSTLNVNVFTPAPSDREAKLPVFVWIHGGGYFAGSPASPWYDGKSFNRSGVVTVTLSYRLGFDGFGWIDDAPLNRGILDQIAALTWVQENIAEFGGDPANVTIGGQSAGGGSVLTLLSAPAARGLFSAAISHSGALSRRRPEAARDIARRLADAVGSGGTDRRAWCGVTQEVILEHERDATLARMLQPSPGTSQERVSQISDPREDTLGLAFVPVVDGETVIDFEDAVEAGHHRDTPLLLGTTYNEFATPLGADNLTDIAAALRAGGASSDSVHQFEAEANRLGSGYGRSQLMAQAMFRLPAVHIASERAATGSGDRTWLYDFRHRSPVLDAAAHCLELPFVWDQLDAPGVAAVLGDAPPQHLADTMHADWVGFIRDRSCPWPAVSRSPAGAKVYDASSAYDPDAYRLEHELCTNRPD